MVWFLMKKLELLQRMHVSKIKDCRYFLHPNGCQRLFCFQTGSPSTATNAKHHQGEYPIADPTEKTLYLDC